MEPQEGAQTAKEEGQNSQTSLSFASKPKGQLLEVGEISRRSRVETGLSGSLSQTRGKACLRGRAMRAEAWLEVLTCSVWKMESRDGSGESGGLSRRGVEGKYEG